MTKVTMVMYCADGSTRDEIKAMLRKLVQEGAFDVVDQDGEVIDIDLDESYV